MQSGPLGSECRTIGVRPSPFIEEDGDLLNAEQRSSDATARESIESLITEAPKVHDWGNGPTSGGIEGDILRTLVHYLCDELGVGRFRSIETGSGLTTLVFAAAQPVSHIAINPDAPVRERIFAEAERRDLSLDNVRYIAELSELVLPDLAKSEQVDLAFIDGGHGWPTVFVDFCYMNMMLRKGGVMVVDDIMTYPCGQLFLLLKHQPGWRLEKVDYSKTAFFRKETDARLMPGCFHQPFLRNNMILT